MTIRNINYRHLVMVFIMMGFASMISQVILLRELVLFFTGNELTLGIMLGLWLLWTAMGSGPVGRWLSQQSSSMTLLIVSLLLWAILLPLAVIFIRVSKALFALPVGEITSPIFILIVPQLALAPICIIVGFLYTLGCKLLSLSRENHAAIPGHVFLWEAIGSGIAGFIASVFLFRWLENFQIITIICAINLMMAMFIWNLIKPKSYIILAPVVLLFLGAMIFYFPKWNDFSNKKRWQPLQLVDSKTTIYGNIAVTGLGESISFYENGVLMFTNPDLMYAEESVHFALLEHPDPQKVLLIGGDAAGSLPQILTHPNIKQVDFLLIDPTVIQLAKKHLPGLDHVLKDKRITIYFQDGRMFLKQIATIYDVIIVNLPDPQTALINRFYTLEFYRSLYNNLARDGILSFSVPSSENVLSKEQTIFLSCLYHTMKQVFADIILIPGNSIHFIGCLSPRVLTSDPQVLVNRLHQRKLPVIYMREYYIPFRMASDRMNYIAQTVADLQTSIDNRDFRPIGYFYNMLLWLSYFHIDLEAIYRVLNHFNLYSIVILVFLFITPMIIGLAWPRLQSPGSKRNILLTIMAIGYLEISLEVLIILGFQAIYGYAYYQLSLIISGFMIGLTCGSWFALSSLTRITPVYRDFIRMQVWLTAYPLITLSVLIILRIVILPDLLIQLIFLLLIIGAGFIGGYQFPLANHLIFQNQTRIEAVAGTLYAMDLIGSVIGALLSSTLFIPIFGIGYSCVALSLLNAGVVITLWKNK